MDLDHARVDGRCEANEQACTADAFLDPVAPGPVVRPSGEPLPRRRRCSIWPRMTRRAARVRVGPYLCLEGSYSSHVTEWRKLRDAGVLDSKAAGVNVGKLSAEQAEIVRLRAQLDNAERRLARTEVALSIRG